MHSVKRWRRSLWRTVKWQTMPRSYSTFIFWFMFSSTSLFIFVFKWYLYTGGRGVRNRIIIQSRLGHTPLTPITHRPYVLAHAKPLPRISPMLILNHTRDREIVPWSSNFYIYLASGMAKALGFLIQVYDQFQPCRSEVIVSDSFPN